MFSIGDKIVYPMYGAGIIEELKEKEIDGELRSYYVMTIPVSNLKIMVSVLNAKSIGLREVYNSSEVKKILNETMQLQPTNVPENWNQRYKNNMDKIKTGELEEVLEVFRNLTHRESERGLSSAEKKMLSNTKQIIISELILTQNISKDEAEEMLNISYSKCKA